MGANWRWLIIKTGGNQRYIFGSNKRRLNVGASRLVTMLPAWVRSATKDDAQHVREVVVVSGVVQLLVDDADVARKIVEQVTRQALRDAPGLEVWGWFEEKPPPGESLSSRLQIALRRHEQHRSRLVPSELRNPGIPFSERCAVTSVPAAFRRGGVRFGDDQVHVAPSCHAQDAAASEALRSIKNVVLGAELAGAVLSLANLEKDVTNAGWVAVVHADGNGFGQMFADLGREFPGDKPYREVLGELSRELEVVARDGLRRAVDDVATSMAQPRQEWLLPLMVGGDDLTAVVDARLARPFVEAYLRAFEECSGQSTTVAKVARSILGTDHLTACAGVAIVKPTHPFSQAYDLAEALCESAKTRVRAISSRRVSAYDIQVFHEAAGRRLADVRASGAAGGAMAAVREEGPFVTSDLPEAGSGGDVGGGDEEWLRQHSATLLSEAVDELAGGLFSRSAAHDVRTALTDGPAAFAHRRDVLVARFALAPRRDDDGARQQRGGVVAVEAWLARHERTRGLTALDLVDVETAVAQGREREGVSR